MKDDIKLIEYFNKRGWALSPKQFQLMVASYNLGYHDALLGSSDEVKE